MCYDIAYFTKKIEAYEKRFGATYGEKPRAPVYHVSGFSHPEVPVITGPDLDRVQMFVWGLIPFFIKDPAGAAKIQKSTLNARGETLFAKPSFRKAAARRRCLVLVDGFYDHHWHNGKSYPYFICMKDEAPFALGGIWERWKYDGFDRYTFSIVTTDPNQMMAFIHNKPAASETPRMPFIVPQDLEKHWIAPDLPQEDILSMIGPHPDDVLESYTVPRLRGKDYPGNVPEVMEKREYDMQ